jgi:hypothetical protein
MIQEVENQNLKKFLPPFLQKSGGLFLVKIFRQEKYDKIILIKERRKIFDARLFLFFLLTLHPLDNRLGIDLRSFHRRDVVLNCDVNKYKQVSVKRC